MNKVLCCLLLASGTLLLVSQEKKATTIQVAASEIIDGSKEPSRIPDETAWWMLLVSLADRAAVPFEARSAALKSRGFTDVESKLLIQAANLAAVNVDRMEAEAAVSMANLGMGAKRDALLHNRNEIIADSVGYLRSRQSPSGMAKMQRHVDEVVKRGIRIHPGN